MSKLGVCLLSIIPCRKSPSDRSEMVTQLLFGERYSIIEEENNWVHIKTQLDNYECYIDKKQCYKLTSKDGKNEGADHVSSELIHPILNKTTQESFPILYGSVVPPKKRKRSIATKTEFHFEGNSVQTSTLTSRSKVIESALLFLNTPYLWGGRSLFGIDCSGFTQLVMRANGMNIPRDAYQQVKLGHSLSFVEESSDADLAFFDNEQGKIIHVGIMIGQDKIIHASGKVRIDTIDNKGIYNESEKKYSHQLRVIKSIFP